MNRIFVFTICILAISSCRKDDTVPDVSDGQFIKGKGLFILSEGGFNQGNASIAYYQEEEGSIYNDIFYNKNQRLLGDVANSMTIHGDRAYIIVNNSATIEVVDIKDFSSIATIEGFGSPRNMLIIDNEKAYVTDLILPVVHIIDLTNNTISGNISTGKSTEAIVMVNNRVFVSNWSNFFVPAANNTIQYIDPSTDQFIDSLVVTKEPNSMVVDNNNKLWVLCSGGYLGEEDPALLRINPEDLSIEETYLFLNESEYPADLTINKASDQMYWLNGGIYTMSTEGSSLPQQALREAIGAGYSCLSINGAGNRIYAGDALDYQQKGIVYIFDLDGVLTAQVQSGVVPGFILPY